MTVYVHEKNGKYMTSFIGKDGKMLYMVLLNRNNRIYAAAGRYEDKVFYKVYDGDINRWFDRANMLCFINQFAKEEYKKVVIVFL